MTNDLPARLRKTATYALMDAARATVLEAADEIARLRLTKKERDYLNVLQRSAYLTPERHELVRRLLERTA